MKPGLVLSDEQCSKRFGPRKGEEEEGPSEVAGDKNREYQKEKEEILSENSFPPISVEHETNIENEFSVLIDNEKSYEDQNKKGRQLFLSLFKTGSVNNLKLVDEEIEKLDEVNENLASMLSLQIDRQICNARKFLPFNQPSKDRNLFHSNGKINIADVLSTLIEQTVLVLKHNKHFNSLPKGDQAELVEENVLVASLISCFQLYNRKQKKITWSMAEADFKYLRSSTIKTESSRVSFGLQEVLQSVEKDIQKDIMKIFSFFEYFSQIGLTKQAINLLIVVLIFIHDNLNLEDKKTVEDHRSYYLLLLYDCLSQTEGVLGACNIAAKLHTSLHTLHRLCQILGQRMVSI